MNREEKTTKGKKEERREKEETHHLPVDTFQAPAKAKKISAGATGSRIPPA